MAAGLSQSPAQIETPALSPESNWVHNVRVLWTHRAMLGRVLCIALVTSSMLALLVPKVYVSEARIMPPETGSSNSAMLAALAGHSFEGGLLGGLAASLMGTHNSGALFVDLLRSSSVSGVLIDRFDLRRVYGKRYRVDAAKVLARRTAILQDKKSGVLSIAVKDRDPVRARDMVQAYLDALNLIVTRTSTSSARQERLFIEARLAGVKKELAHAQIALSEFSSTHSAIDLREQTRATVESEARVQGELIAAQSEAGSLRQIYGDKNVRVRAADSRVSTLQHELEKMGGTSAPLADSATQPRVGLADSAGSRATSYLPLRQVPRLAVPYADLYREVRVQETVYDLLTQQYEVARIQEAKDIPVVNVIDAPGVPEKKSFPPRILLALALTLAILAGYSVWLILRNRWSAFDPQDPRRILVREMITDTAEAFMRIGGRARRST